jgi:hypothetical protein
VLPRSLRCASQKARRSGRDDRVLEGACIMKDATKCDKSAEELEVKSQ